MPFTFSHPAAVLPLKRFTGKYLSFPALLAGSIVPDFEYFIHFKSSISHSLKGLLMFNLPVGLLLLVIFFAFVRDEHLFYTY